MAEQIAAYALDRPPDSQWSWTSRFRLPRLAARNDVLAIIDHGIQHVEQHLIIPPDEDIAIHGLSGVLIGPHGDPDAEEVQDVVFASDPSRRYGIREAADMDHHALLISEEHDWRVVDVDGNELDPLTDEVIERDIARVIMGRNLDQYEGENVASLASARDKLPYTTKLETYGGYLFSGRPGVELYGEPAIVLQREAHFFDWKDRADIAQLALGLNRQHRYVIETPHGTEVYRLHK